jgi:hypothetical protein
MSGAGVFSNQAIGGLAVRNLDVSLLAQLLAQQRIAGAAMVGLIEGSAPRGGGAARQPASPPPSQPPQAAEPGKGTLVDVTA